MTAQQQVGGSVLIQGSVLDTSPGSSSATLKAMFPNGVPAISDANMSVWMDYLYMQNSTLLNNPPECIGVPVTLTAVSSTGTTVNLGTVTSNYLGNYAYPVDPNNRQDYTLSTQHSQEPTHTSLIVASTGATVSSISSITNTNTRFNFRPSNHNIRNNVHNHCSNRHDNCNRHSQQY